MTTEITETLDATLAHFGIPGMKWGQRKGSSASDGVSSSKAGSLDELRKAPGVKIQKMDIGRHKGMEIATIPIAALPKHHGPPMTYIGAVTNPLMPKGKGIRLANGDELMTTPFGKTNIRSDEQNYIMTSKAERIQRENELKQSATEMLDATLSHFGIPGMKWGHRKSRGSSISVPTGPESVQIKQNRKGNLETSGGRGHNPSPDALNAVALRQKAHASGTHSLSNIELQTLVSRMNLESNYQKAITAGKIPKQKNLLEKFIEGEKNMLISGKKPKTAKLVEAIIAASAGNKHVSRHNKAYKRP